MKAIMVMFDSPNRRMLPPYGCDWVHAPNFARLAERTATFDNSYVASMPCMPARRELHTGRLNFLHRSWGPLEPFDDSISPSTPARSLASSSTSRAIQGSCTTCGIGRSGGRRAIRSCCSSCTRTRAWRPGIRCPIARRRGIRKATARSWLDRIRRRNRETALVHQTPQAMRKRTAQGVALTGTKG